MFLKWLGTFECPDSEVRFILGVGRKSAMAEPLDAGQDVVGGLGPAERLGVGIGGLDVDFDRCFELGHRAEHAASQGTLGQQRKEALDLINPGSPSGEGRLVGVRSSDV
jgi:hypothetical protein